METITQFFTGIFGSHIAQAFAIVFSPDVILVVCGASIFGLSVGSMPGLTATMATALLVPVTFFMDPVPAIAAIVTCEAMAIFAGDIPAALLRIPGTPASAAYTEESYAMCRAGKLELALGIDLVSSILGGIFGTVILVWSARELAEFALNFSSFEYFWLASLGLSCAAMLATEAPLKGVISLCFGIFLSTVGLAAISGYPRFTYGVTDLLGGISFIPAMIGMFAISELLRYSTSIKPKLYLPQTTIGNIFKGLGPTLYKYKVNLVRGSLIGTIIGILPGAGGDIAAWVTFALSKKLSKEQDQWGKGHPEGLVDAGAANNAALGGAWVPALVFGIPGDSITAIAIGVLYMKGLTPGPMIFVNQPVEIYGVFITFFLANILMLPFGWAAIRASKHILRMPMNMLMPVILMFCVVGSFAINNSVFGVGIMLTLGIIAFVMEENSFPIAPAILGIVLGPLVEENFVTSMIKSDGSIIGFFDRPISGTLGVVTLIMWSMPVLMYVRQLRRRRATS